MTQAVLTHLVESTAFALLIGSLTLAFRANGAHVRFWLWFAASVKFLIPFAVIVAVGKSLRWDSAPAVAVDFPWPTTFDDVIKPIRAAAAPVEHSASGPTLASILLAIWAAGIVFLLCRWTLQGLRLRATLKASVPAQIAAPIPVRLSKTLFEPGLVGIFRPVLLLPENISEQLSPAQLALVIEHELCHWRRRDNLIAAIHMAVELVFWFHPFVWWIGARLVAERECACDESIVAAGRDPKTYADSILEVCRFYVRSPLSCASGVAGASLKHRMERIMENTKLISVSRAKQVLLATVATAALLVPMATGFLALRPTMAQAQTNAPLSPEERAQKLAEQQQPRTAIPFDSKQFDKYVGFYQMGPYTFFTITRQGEHFFGGAAVQPNIEFYPESPSKFFATVVVSPGRTFALQISFVTDAQGHTTELVLHQGGLEQHGPKADEGVVKAARAQLAQHIKDKTPSPGTEAMLRRYILAFEKGQPNYNEMTPVLATLVRGEVQGYLDYFKQWGPLQSLTFADVAESGMDEYIAVYEHAVVPMYIGPVSADGKMTTRAIGFVGTPEVEAAMRQSVGTGKPATGTEALVRRQIDFMEKGEVDYDDMTPRIAAQVRPEAPGAFAAIQKIGALKLVVFKNVTPIGLDVYEATFEHGSAELVIAPPQSDGKTGYFTFHPVPNP